MTAMNKKLFGESDKTYSEILDGIKEERAEWQSAYELAKSL